MIKNLDKTEQAYSSFVEQVLESKMVWGLQNEDGDWAISESHEYEETDVYVFWSDKDHAARHANGIWSEYSPASIDLDSFIDDWLPGMHDDNHLVGPNWDDQLCGKEIEPEEIAQKLSGT